MKKSLIAIAAMAATGVFAQSSVTIYGIVEATADVGYKRTVDTKVTNVSSTLVTTNNSVATKNGFRIQDGNDQGVGTSRIGFRGTEDLGGGLKGNFLLEMGIRVDDGCVTVNGTVPCSSGNSGGNLFGRNAWGGLSGGFGEVRVGRQLLGSFLVQGNSWVAGSSNGLYDAASANLPMGGVRFSNAVKYLTPNLSGFTANVTLAAPETEAPTSTTSFITGVTSTAKRRTGFDLALEYANGPAYVGFGYNLRDAANLTDNGTGTISNPGKVTAYTLGGSFDLGVVKPYANYTNQLTKFDSAVLATLTAGESKGTAVSFGVKAPVGPVTLIAGYARLKTKGFTNTTGLSSGSVDQKRDSYQIGAQYPLSKRTLVEVNYGQSKDVGTTVSAALPLFQTSTLVSDKINAFNVGLRHSF